MTEVKENYIKQIVPPYENYYVLEQKREIWEFGLVIVERQNELYLKQKKTIQIRNRHGKILLT